MTATPTPEDWLAILAGHGERPALVGGRDRWSYASLAEAAGTLGAALDAAGVVAGDLVAVRARPSLPGVALLHALLARRIGLLPLNARLAPRELRDALEASGARFLAVDEAAVVEDARPAGAPDRTDPDAAALAEATGCGLLAFGAGGEDGATLRVLRAPAASRVDEDAARRARRQVEGAALVLRTSGTSGRPKGAVLGFDNLMASAAASGVLLGEGADDRWLLCMPLFHVGGLSIPVRAARAGASVVVHERFDAADVARALERDGITHVSWVATMLERVLAERGDAPSPPALLVVLLGGGPASDDLLERAARLGYPIAPTYGLTEAASQVATRPPGRVASEPAGGLEALPGVSIRIVDDAGRARGPGEVGLIEVRGPNVMRGYLDDPEATAATLRDGWLATGDLGRLDENGGLRVLDRRADLIVSGGENVYPAEVESVLAEHPAIREVGVAGVPDATFGARPAAWIVVESGADATTPGADATTSGADATTSDAALDAFCRERLAGFKCPVAYHRVEALPRTATGKLRRAALSPPRD